MVFGFGTCVCVSAVSPSKARKDMIAAQQGKQPDSQAKAATIVATVQLGTLLSDYKGNEVRADSNYKGRTIQVSGIVDDVKKDLFGKPYVTIGSGTGFEIPQVQCSAGKNQEAAFANLDKGQKVTVQGEVDGLMMNVLLSGCVIK